MSSWAVQVLLKLACALCGFASAGHEFYNKPPCQQMQTYAQLFDRVLCTSECTKKTPCPAHKPLGTFADAQCVLEIHPDHKPNNTESTMYCGLVCTANSYCPKGSRCTKGAPGSMITKSDDDAYASILPGSAADQFRGVCTFKAKSKKSSKDKERLQLQLSKVLAVDVLKGMRESLGVGEL